MATVLRRRLARTLILYTILSSMVIFTILTIQRHHNTGNGTTDSVKAQSSMLSLNECIGSSPDDRICRMSMFCYDFATNQYIHHHPRFILHQYHNESDRRYADQSSVHDHNTYYWQWKTEPQFGGNYSIVPHFTNSVTVNLPKQVMIVEEPVLLVKRFFPVNIMHLFHDDLLGWQDVINRVNKDIKQLWFVDDYGGPIVYESVYEWFRQVGISINHLLKLKAPSNLPPDMSNRMVCFKDATVGTSKRFVWYQYGYKDRQSPIAHNINTGDLVEAFSWFRARANVTVVGEFETKRAAAFRRIAKKQRPAFDPNLQITIFTRSKTRLLLNTPELMDHLKREFNLPVRLVGLESMSIEQVVEEMSRTAIAVGLHGSLLVMAGFMPPGGVLIEGFPFAVPPLDYQPYRELCKIVGHQYGAWSSPHSGLPNTIGHPDRGKFEGGLSHLAAPEKEAILSARWINPHRCCYDAAWLYRIFQDTAMDTADVVDMIRESIVKLLIH